MTHDMQWCCKQAKGVRLIAPNETLMRVYLRKSRSALNMLQAAIERDEPEWILDTSYYAKYFATYALFMKAGIRCEIHDCTIAALRILFSAPEPLCTELERSRDLRVDALYYSKEIGRDAIRKRAAAAGEYCLQMEAFTTDLVDVETIRKRLKKITIK